MVLLGKCSKHWKSILPLAIALFSAPLISNAVLAEDVWNSPCMMELEAGEWPAAACKDSPSQESSDPYPADDGDGTATGSGVYQPDVDSQPPPDPSPRAKLGTCAVNKYVQGKFTCASPGELVTVPPPAMTPPPPPLVPGAAGLFYCWNLDHQEWLWSYRPTCD
jgi:hypothetical protein